MLRYLITVDCEVVSGIKENIVISHQFLFHIRNEEN